MAYSTKSDLVTNKTLYLNGKKMKGVRAVAINYDLDNIVTEVTLRMVVKRGSVKITDDTISFDEVA